jgi:hypothetical protein
MVSIFDFIKSNLTGLSHMTALLESCDWDESVMDEKISIFKDVLEALPLDQIKEQGFDVWVGDTLIPVLVLNGLTKNQAQIMSKVIFNSRDELRKISTLGEN